MDLDKLQKPSFSYTRCLHATCPRSGTCLRHQAALRPEQEPIRYSIYSPAYLLSLEGDCPYYQEDKPSRFALGITHLYDNLTHTQEKKVRQALTRRFKNTPYYHIRNKERLIKPAEIEFIRQVFIQEGIAWEPPFDEYFDLYDWQD